MTSMVKPKNEHRKLLDVAFAVFGAGWPLLVTGIIKLISNQGSPIPEIYAGLAAIIIGSVFIWSLIRTLKNLKKHYFDMGLALFAPATPICILGFIGKDHILGFVALIALIIGLVLNQLGEKYDNRK
jgi:hypothetical protein